MSLWRLALRHPVATRLLGAGLALAGVAAALHLPVAPLPRVAFPTLLVQAKLPGAAARTVAASLATPLERQLGQIADLRQMTSESVTGGTRITLEFGLDRAIDGAARDVQAAISAALADLPAQLRFNPTYRKVNPAEAPMLILALQSDRVTPQRLYETAAVALQTGLSRIAGVGLVDITGGGIPAVRVELDPAALFSRGIGLESLRQTLVANSAVRPLGGFSTGARAVSLTLAHRPRRAADFRSVVIAYHNGAAVRLGDVARVVNGVEDVRRAGFAGSTPAVLLLIYREPGANIVAAARRVRARLPALVAGLPQAVTVRVMADDSATIRASLAEGIRTLGLSVLLVVGVVFLFLRLPGLVVVPAMAIGVSLLGSLAVLYLMNYGLDTLSLMALTLATGFVVDDTVVVMEAVAQRLEAGVPAARAVTAGLAQTGPAILAMTLALLAVFVPLLLMPGVAGRLLHEFAMTLAAAVAISFLVAVTLTPVACQQRLGAGAAGFAPGRPAGAAATWLARAYRRGLGWGLDHSALAGAVLLACLGFSAYALGTLPREFFPRQDTGRLIGSLRGDEAISFTALRDKLLRFSRIVQADPAVASVVAYTGGRAANEGYLFASLKPPRARAVSAEAVMARLRPRLAAVTGARLYLKSAQDLRVSAREGPAAFAYTLRADRLDLLAQWAPRLLATMRAVPGLEDVTSDFAPGGRAVRLVLDRASAARAGLDPAVIDETLDDAYGQRQIATLYGPRDAYQLVMTLAPAFSRTPAALDRLYVARAHAPLPAGITPPVPGTPLAGALPVAFGADTLVPLGAVTRMREAAAMVAVNHDGGLPAVTISFNLGRGKTLAGARRAIAAAVAGLRMPPSLHGTLGGDDAAAPGRARQMAAVLAALLAGFVVLGIFYESLLDPLIVLSTVPSAGSGALLAFWLSGTMLSLVALVGIILLIGISQKNAILIVDAARRGERAGAACRVALEAACAERLRPILMTTAATLLAALPLLLMGGVGAALRRPLGLALVGGLTVSQALSLFTTPAMYMWLSRLRRRPRTLPSLEGRPA